MIYSGEDFEQKGIDTKYGFDNKNQSVREFSIETPNQRYSNIKSRYKSTFEEIQRKVIKIAPREWESVRIYVSRYKLINKDKGVSIDLVCKTSDSLFHKPWYKIPGVSKTSLDRLKVDLQKVFDKLFKEQSFNKIVILYLTIYSNNTYNVRLIDEQELQMMQQHMTQQMIHQQMFQDQMTTHQQMLQNQMMTTGFF